MQEINIHILGAGKPFEGYKNNALRDATQSMKVLDWQLQELSTFEGKIHFVGGYKYDEIIKKYPYLNLKINPLWESSGPITSLLESNLESKKKNVYCYGDILFKSKTIENLVLSSSDIAIAIDTRWKTRYKERNYENLQKSEKVKLKDGEIIDVGSNVNLEEAGAEFAGIVSFNPKVSEFIKNNSKSLIKNFKEKPLLQLISYLMSLGFSIEGKDVNNQWAELNNSNDLINFIFGTKAQTLKELSKFLKKSKIEEQYCFTVKEWKENQAKVILKIEENFTVDKIVIRSSSLNEDTFETANAGKFKSILNINKNSRFDIKKGINEVIDSYKDNSDQNQVLIQPMVLNTKISGVIFTHTLTRGAPYYVINYDDESGNTESITSGRSENSSTIIISRNKIKSNLKVLPHLMQNLLPAIHEIEDLLDFSYLDIEFAITEDKIIHLFQVRPMTIQYQFTDIDDNEIFNIINNAAEDFNSLKNPKPFILGDQPIYGLMPDWNPAEIIGAKPSKLSFTIYCYLITDNVWAKQRADYGYRDLRPNKLLRSFGGQPFIDVRASINSFIPKSLSDKLAKKLIDFYSSRLIENPDLHDKLEFEVLPTCFSLDFHKWESRLLNSDIFNIQEIKQYSESMKTITINGINRIDKDLNQLKNLNLRFNKIRQAKCKSLEKALMLLDDCKLLGTLPFAHLARAAFIAITILNSAVSKRVISKNAYNSFLSSIKTVSHEFTEDLKKIYKSNNRNSWDSFLKKYGHLRPGTYDITSLSYFEAKDLYLSKENNIESEQNNPDIYPWNQEKKNLFDDLRKEGISFSDEEFEKFFYTSIEGREYSKFIFTKNLSASLDYLIDFGRSIGLTRDSLSHLSLNCFYEYQKGLINDLNVGEIFKKLSSESKNQRKIDNHIELPVLITKEEDFFSFKEAKSKPNYIGTKKITAEIININGIKNNLEFLNLEDKIIIIENADPGFDWIFSKKIRGLITMFGGGNSHMAIRAAEFQLPAAIGVGFSLFKKLINSKVIELDCNKKTIKIIR